MRLMKHEVIVSEESVSNFELIVARSAMLDAFGDLEARICCFLKDAKQLPKSQPLRSKIEAFKSLPGMPQLAKANLAKRDTLADEISQLLPIRADVVHSRMTRHDIDGKQAAIFVNSQNRSDAYPPCRILTEGDMRRITKDVLRIVTELGNLGRVVNPASSPQPPSPGAKGDP